MQYNKNQQSDSASVSPFVHKDAQKAPSMLRSCGWRYVQIKETIMLKILSIAIVLLSLISCASGPTPSQQFIDNLRTDGTYISKGGDDTSEKGYLRFYLNDDGSKHLKAMLMKGFNITQFEENANKSTFTVKPDNGEIKYRLNQNGVSASVVLKLSKFTFNADQP